MLGAGASESVLPAAHAPLPRGCGHITRRGASVTPGLTCSRGPAGPPGQPAAVVASSAGQGLVGMCLGRSNRGRSVLP